MSTLADMGRTRRTALSWSVAALLTFSVVVAIATLAISSHPAGAPGFRLFVLALIGLSSIGAWLTVAIFAATQRHLPAGLVIAPMIGVLTIALLYFSIPSRIRFAVFDRAAFDAIVAGAPTPVVDLPGRDLTEDESYASFIDFPGQCPDRIGSLRIRECTTFAAGYLFYDVAGSGFIDDGGVAYLPEGVPVHDVGNGSFESPSFRHLAGPWYAFASSW